MSVQLQYASIQRLSQGQTSLLAKLHDQDNCNQHEYAMLIGQPESESMGIQSFWQQSSRTVKCPPCILPQS